MIKIKQTALIALNGKLLGSEEDYQKLLADRELFIIAADGGANFLNEINLKPDVILGDLDSLSRNEVIRYREAGVEIKRYPREKEETDGELALQYCQENGFTDILIFGATGGRFDQQMANIYLLEFALRTNLTAVIKEPGIEVGLIDQKHIFNEKQGFQLSLLPISSQVTGVSITGCKYKLFEETLYRYKTRGISNQIIDEEATVCLKDGLILYSLQNKSVL